MYVVVTCTYTCSVYASWVLHAAKGNVENTWSISVSKECVILRHKLEEGCPSNPATHTHSRYFFCPYISSRLGPSPHHPFMVHHSTYALTRAIHFDLCLLCTPFSSLCIFRLDTSAFIICMTSNAPIQFNQFYPTHPAAYTLQSIHQQRNKPETWFHARHSINVNAQ